MHNTDWLERDIYRISAEKATLIEKMGTPRADGFRLKISILAIGSWIGSAILAAIVFESEGVLSAIFWIGLILSVAVIIASKQWGMSDIERRVDDLDNQEETLRGRLLTLNKSLWIQQQSSQQFVRASPRQAKDEPLGSDFPETSQVLRSKRSEYKRYLASEEWKAKANLVRVRAGYRCQLCNNAGPGPLNVHHRTYDNIFDEKPEDLIALCESCHNRFHDR